MRRIQELYLGPLQDRGDDTFVIPGFRDYAGQKLRIHILAMGDVGSTLALAMKLTGPDIVSEIGICDISETVLARWEQELNQIALPSEVGLLPQVRPVPVAELFDCDVFVFCASWGVPDLSQTEVDVRMAQLEKNLELVRVYADQAVCAGYDGEFFIVSDPVDPLCKGAVTAGIRPQRVQGFGLGVMNGRAAYHARIAAGCSGRLHTEMARYLAEGRVFGPHGQDLVVANSVFHYCSEASIELTRRTVASNVKIRELGYKPYIAPAVTSGALSILEDLRGNWQYSSAWFGEDPGQTLQLDGAFLGMRNKRSKDGLLIEDLPLDELLFARIERAYRNLKRL